MKVSILSTDELFLYVGLFSNLLFGLENSGIFVICFRRLDLSSTSALKAQPYHCDQCVVEIVEAARYFC